MSNAEEYPTGPPISKPPLGEAPAFILEMQEQQRGLDAGLATIEFKHVEAFEDLVPVFDKLSEFATAFQTSYGADSQPLDSASVRIHSPEDLKLATQSLPNSEGTGVFDPDTGIIHVERGESESLFERIQFYYELAHETGHKLTGGLNESGSRLGFVGREGTADRFARDFMNTVVMPTFFPNISKEEIAKKLSELDTPDVVGGVKLTANDTFYISTEENGRLVGSACTRTSEVRAIEALEASVGVDVFNEFMRLAISGNTSALQFLGDKLEQGTWDGVDLKSIGTALTAEEVISSLVKP